MTAVLLRWYKNLTNAPVGQIKYKETFVIQLILLHANDTFSYE